MLTRPGEAGSQAVTIMKIAGHSSVTVIQRSVHPTPEAVERDSATREFSPLRQANFPPANRRFDSYPLRLSLQRFQNCP